MSSIIKARTFGLDGVLAEQGAALEPPLTQVVGNESLVPLLPHSQQRGALTLLRKARQRANTLLAQARTEAEQIRERARQEGYIEGLQQGKEQGFSEGTTEGTAIGWGSGVSQAQGTLRTANNLLEAIEAERYTVFDGLEHVVVELAMVVAEKIVQREIARDDEYITRLLNNAMQVLSTGDRMVAHVHPSTLEQTANIGQELISHLQFIADETLAPGDCVIESDSGLLDGKISNRLASVRQALEDAVGQ